MSVTCSICIVSFEDEDENKRDIVALKCGHAFHKTCLQEWKNSSKQMTCPECRSKYTARTLSKLYLNILPKDPSENIEGATEIYGELQTHKQKSAELQKDKERAIQEKQQMEMELMKSRQEYQTLMQNHTNLDINFKIKCQEYALIRSVNDDYLSTNEMLREENQQLKQQNQQISQELTVVKVQQLKSSKPFVDLTRDDDSSDDSDIEIIEDDIKTNVESPKGNDKNVELGEEVIELDTDDVMNGKSIKQCGDGTSNVLGDLKQTCTQGETLIKQDAAVEDSWNDLQQFEQFLLSSI